MKAMEKVVVFRPGALGDTLLAFPALATLRLAFPNARLTAIGNAPALMLARAAGLADEVFDFDLPWWAELFSEDGIHSPEAIEALSGARLVVSWVWRDVRQLARNLSALGVQGMLGAPGRPAEERQIHATDYLLSNLHTLGQNEETTRQRPKAVLLTPTPEAQTWAEAEWARRGLTGMRVLILHPGSGGQSKCWPSERFAALARRFIIAGWRVLIIEGPADAAAAAQVLQALPSERAQRLSRLALPQLAALLARATLYVGNDSGVSHLSAMVGAPTLALFGPTNPLVWAPRGPRVRVIWHSAEQPGAAGHPMTDLSVDEVYAASLIL